MRDKISLVLSFLLLMKIRELKFEQILIKIDENMTPGTNVIILFMGIKFVKAYCLSPAGLSSLV
jgi:hypothetical protein